MFIKFKAPDPRAGLVVQIDNLRGQDFIDGGQALAVNEDGVEVASQAAGRAGQPGPSGESGGKEPSAGSILVDQNAADVLAAIPKVTDAAVLEEALTAEKAKGDKGRKKVLDALQAAISKAQQG